MAVQEILAEFDSEIARLNEVRNLLAGHPPVKQQKKRTLSAEARAKIAAAQKRRWAKQNAAKKAG